MGVGLVFGVGLVIFIYLVNGGGGLVVNIIKIKCIILFMMEKIFYGLYTGIFYLVNGGGRLKII